MELLDDSQTERVWNALQDGYLKQNKLADELLDHFCCFIEEKMKQGEAFEDCLTAAFISIAPNGPDELEEELEFILTLNPQKKMKLTFYISAMISTFLILIGILLRTLHWHEIASLVLLTGFACLLFVVLPAIGVMAFRNRAILDRLDKFRLTTGLFSGILISVGTIFKHLHYPGAAMLMGLGMLILCFVFLPIFFYQLYKRAIL